MTEEEQQVRLPLTDYVRELAREAARTVIEEHRQSCPIGELEPRVRKLEWITARLIGIVAGAGAVGGIVGTLLSNFF